MKIQPESGRRPWEPAPTAQLAYVLDHHDFPQSGLIEQDGQMYLFTVVLGEVDDDNLWIYAPVRDDELPRIYEARGDEVLDIIEETIANRMVVVAAAFGFELEVWHQIDAGQEGSIKVVSRFLDRWQTQLAQQEDKADEFAQSKVLSLN